MIFLKLLKTACSQKLKYFWNPRNFVSCGVVDDSRCKATMAWPGERLASRALVIFIALFFFTLLIPSTLAANDPGHDSLYIEQNGNSELTGNLNITQYLRVNQRFAQDYLDVQGNGTTFAPTYNGIFGTAGTFYIDGANGIRINSLAGVSQTVYFGYGASQNVNVNISGDLEVDGTITKNGVNVCLSNGTNCVGGGNTGNVSSIIAGNGISVDQSIGDVTVSASAATCGAGEYSYWTGSAWLCRADDTGSSLWTNSSGNATFTSGRVGIGTTSPENKLHIIDGEVSGATSNAQSPLVVEGTLGNGNVNIDILAANTATSSLLFGDPESSSAGNFGYHHDSDYFTFASQGTELMRLQGNGNLGIGTSSPGSALDVNGTINTKQLCDESGSNCKNISGGWYELGGSATINANTGSQSITTAWTTIDLTSEAWDTNNLGSVDATNEVYTFSKSGYYLINVWTELSNTPHSTKIFRNAGALLTADGDSDLDQHLAMAQYYNVDDNLSIQLKSSSGTQTLTGAKITITKLDSTTSGAGNVWGKNNDDAYFTSGNVGIGTTTPGEALDVVGNINASGDICLNSGECLSTAAGSNADTLDTLDSTSFLRSDADDIMDGGLKISKSTGNSYLFLNATSSARNAELSFLDQGTKRWAFYRMNTDASGDLYLGRFSSAGAWQTNPLVISEATGSVTVGNTLAVTGTLDPNGAVTLPTSGISGAGSGSGLDADKLDGIEGNQYARSDVFTETDFDSLTANSRVTSISASSNTPFGSGWYNIINTRHRGGISDGNNYGLQIVTGMTANRDSMAYRTQSAGTWDSWKEIWNNASDGSGSGLDADLFDGRNSDDFIDDDGDTMNGVLNMNSQLITNIGSTGTDFTTGGALTLAGALTVSGAGDSSFAGDVGIGTASPSRRLHVKNTGDNNVGIIVDSGDATYTKASIIDFRHNGAVKWDVGKSSTNDFYIYDHAAAKTAFFIDDTTGNVGIGSSSPGANLHVGSGTPGNATGAGDLYVTSDIEYDGNLYGPGADLAERIEASEDNLLPGMVVELDPSNTKKVRKSSGSYSKLVAGVVSTDPGIILGKDSEGVELAVTGRVPVKVNDENGFIRVGDLITSSSIPGEAMKCDDLELCFGSIIGKAMEPLNSENGEIMVLVSLS